MNGLVEIQIGFLKDVFLFEILKKKKIKNKKKRVFKILCQITKHFYMNVMDVI